MLSRFAEMDRAVWYLCLGFREHHLAEQVEIFWQPLGQHEPRAILTPVGDMEATLRIACRRFSQAIVVYEDNLLEFPFGAIQCRCIPTVHSLCPCHCTHHYERPLVCAAINSGTEPLPYPVKTRILTKSMEIMDADRLSHKSVLRERHRHHSQENESSSV